MVLLSREVRLNDVNLRSRGPESLSIFPPGSDGLRPRYLIYAVEYKLLAVPKAR